MLAFVGSVCCVNEEWMRAKLEAYLRLARACRDAVPPGEHWNASAAEYNEFATEMLPTVSRILEALGAPPKTPLQPPSYSSSDTTQQVRQGLGILKDRAEWAEHLTPEQPPAPFLSAGELHPWVWTAAFPFWDAGQRAAAVEYGAKALTARIQQKSASHLADRELAAEVFSSKPKHGATRLWFSGDRTTDTWRSRQDGLHLLSMGAYAGIRNVVAHSVEPGWSEQEALEYLAVLSTVARWTSETESVTCN